MPWLETAPMEQRERFVRDHRLALYTMAELSARYGISRKTGYKWLDRFDESGRNGLGDRSRAPRRCPHKISDAAATLATLICDARRRHPSWGPDKLLDWLGPRHPTVDFPAVSTAGDLLSRQGLIKKRRRRRHYQHPGVVPITTVQPNDLWTADFKGHFRTRDGVYRYPLTVTDQHTRYLLACHGLLSTKGVGVRHHLRPAVPDYGLPDAIRTDNGVPFATTGIHGLSQLNVWWLRLGIQHQRSRPGVAAGQRRARTDAQDAQGGGDPAAARHARATAGAPEQSLPQPRTTPNGPISSLRAPPPRRSIARRLARIPGRSHPLSIRATCFVKRITNAGTFRFKTRLLFVARSLQQPTIGLEEVADGVWSIHFCRVLLGRFDERDCVIHG